MLKRFVLLVLLGAAVPAFAPASAKDNPLDGAPYCAVPNARPIFVSPMGEPFRGEPGQAYPSVAWFAQADRNHDGVIDRVEFVADADRFFKTLDRNHDGKLDPEEIAAYENGVAPEISLYGPRTRDVVMQVRRGSLGAGESNYYGPMGAGRYTWLNIPEPVASADDDVDRTVSQKEFASAAGRRFEMLDSAGKGGLALKDMRKTPMQQTIDGPCKTRPKPKRRPGERGPGLDIPDGLPNPDDPRDPSNQQRSPR